MAAVSGLDWPNEALPVLHAVHQALLTNNANPGFGVSPEQINAELGREPHDEATAFALMYLIDGGYVRQIMDTDSHFGPAFCTLSERGRQTVAGWPTSPGDALLQSLLEEVERRIETAHSEEEKSALVRFRDFALGMGREVLVSVLSTYADRAVGK